MGLVDGTSGDLDFLKILHKDLKSVLNSKKETQDFYQDLYDLVGTLTLKAGSVTTSDIADGAVTTDKIENAAVTRLKIANNVLYYSMQFFSSNNPTFTDGQTEYFGATPEVNTTTGASRMVYVPKTGTIKAAYIVGIFGTAGTNESWTMNVRLNNGTSTFVFATSSNSATRTWVNTGLSIDVTEGDYLSIESVSPTWATNPADGVFSASLLITY